jgi:protein TonB
MEIKKSDKANLEKNSNTYVLFGLVVVLALVWFSFEYKTYDHDNTVTEQLTMLQEDEDVVLQTQRQETPPPPAPPQQITIIEIVDDDIEVDDLDIDIETDDQEEIEETIIAQEEEKEAVEEEIFVFVEEQPTYPGGDEARLTYLRDNIKYPEIAKESGIQGTVYVTFVVEKDGRISNVKVLRGIGGGCDEEAVRVIKNMPSWKAGKQRGRAVRAQFNMPIRFILAG